MASRNKIFLDTNVLLDHLADRQPFAEHAHRIFSLAEASQITICVSSLSFGDLYYIIRKLKGHKETIALLKDLKRLAHISAVGTFEIDKALSSNFTDFEDAIQFFCAESEGEITAILTRNEKDFTGSTIPVLTPDEYITLHLPPPEEVPDQE